MPNNEQHYRMNWMTDDQWECYDMLGDIFGGCNHILGKLHPWGKGIKLNCTNSNCLATFDFNGLTKAVVLAHDRMIRLEITASGPGMIGLVLHKRKSRTGRMYERHPTLEDAAYEVRKYYQPTPTQE